MIIDAFLSIIDVIERGIIFIMLLIPQKELPIEFYDSLDRISNILATYNLVFPISTFISVLGLIFFIEFLYLIWQFGNWIIRKIPFIN